MVIVLLLLLLLFFYYISYLLSALPIPQGKRGLSVLLPKPEGLGNISYFSVKQNHLGTLLDCTLLDPTTRVSDSKVCCRIQEFALYQVQNRY